MIPRDHKSCLVAPELLVLELADAALVTMLRALHAEHGARLLVSAETNESSIRSRARAVITLAARLRKAIDDYACAVDDVVVDSQRDDLPF